MCIVSNVSVVTYKHWEVAVGRLVNTMLIFNVYTV